MAGRGAAPKPVLQSADKQRRRDEVTTKLADDGVRRGADLPEGDWPQQTLDWWETLRLSPMAQAWVDADWSFLLDTALIHAEMWRGDLKLAGELRLRMSQFGITPDARLRLRMQVDLEEKAVKAASPNIDPARRRRLLKAVSDGGL
jgi:hypothetical protein